MESIQWTEAIYTKKITVYTGQTPNSKLLKIKAVGTLEVALPTLLANLEDVDKATDWTPDLAEKILLEKKNALELVTYSLTNMPWPLFDRSFTLNNKLTFDKEKKHLVVSMHSIEHKKTPLKKRIVEAQMSYGIMSFKPLEPKQTYVELVALVDPKGSIPTWIVNFFQKKWPLKFFLALEKYCLQENPNPSVSPSLNKMIQKLLAEMKLSPHYF